MRPAEHISRKLIIAVFTLFVVTSLLHYFASRPLWLDETFVFESLSEYTYPQFFGPLKTGQAFPRVQLAIVKFISEPFDYHLLSVRVFSLICMISALLLWIRLYRVNLKDHWMTFLCVLAFICSIRINYYTVELKPYAMDMLVVAVYGLYLHHMRAFQDKAPMGRLFAGVCLLPLLIFVSYAGLFVFWMISFNLLLMSFENKRLWPVFWVSAGASCICLIGDYYVCVRHSAFHQGIHDYWKGQFLAANSLGDFFQSFWEGNRKLATWWFGNTRTFMRVATTWIPFFLIPLFGFGFRGWIKDRGKIFSLDSYLAAMYSVLIVLSLLGRYPFMGERITLFFAPLVFYMIVKGLESLRRISLLYYGFLYFYVGFLMVCWINTFRHIIGLYGIGSVKF